MPLPMPSSPPAGASTWQSAPANLDESPEPLPSPHTEYEPLPPPNKLDGTVVPEPTVVVHDGAPIIIGDQHASGDRFWFQGEYLLWWTKGSNLPPLITTGPANAAIPGALGQPSTIVLFGGDVDNNPLSGGRFSGGVWLDAGQHWGIGGSYFFLGQRTTTFNNAGGLTVLAFPFINAATGTESSLLVVGPPQTTTSTGRLPNPGITSCNNSTTTTVGDPFGSAGASFTTRLEGEDLNLLWNMIPGPCDGFNLYFLTGYRYLELHDELTLSSTISTTGTATTFFSGVPSGITGTFSALDQRSDDFDTRNKFYGWQIGAHGSYVIGRFSFDATFKLALGNTREEATIFGAHNASFNGVTNFAGTAFPVSYQQQLLGGIYAQPSNIGKFSRDVFAVVPEVGIGVNYRITNWLRATLSYNFLYWSNVSRVGDIVNRNVSPSAFTPTNFPLQACTVPLPTPAPVTSPTFSFQNSSYFAQGLCFGLEFTF
jgi:hypothetical protein